MRQKTLLLTMLVLLSGCTSPTPGILKTTLPNATYKAFTYCSGYGCSRRWNMVITDEEWQGVLAHFDEAAPNAAAERDQMATAIADIEVITGKKANTSNDRPGAAIFPTYSTRGQLDCIDESHNTTVYLHFLAKEGVFRYHDVGEVAHRGMIIDRWFHNTATVVDRETGERYVIDTWFGANGDRADIIDVETWIGGWSPENFKTRKDR